MTQGADPVAALPAAVRQRVLGLAAEALGAMPASDVPPALRRVARFAPRQRARLGAAAIAGALETDVVLRQRVAQHTAGTHGELVAALGAGAPLPAAEPADVAALAYLLRPDGWPDLVRTAGEQVRRQAEEAGTERAAQDAARLGEQLDAAREQTRVVRERLRLEVERLQAENQVLRRRVQELRERVRQADEGAAASTGAASDAVARAEAARSAAEAEARRLRGRLAEAEATIESTRRAERAGRNIGAARVRLLLDTLGEAASGLRRELALPPTELRPADTVGGLPPGDPETPTAGRLLGAAEPALLEELLALPQVHLVVDGYNVTKQEWGASSLEAQRARLVQGLGALVARTGAEVTVVFDGAELAGRPAVPASRGVRVYFSPPGVIADEVIRRLVQAEPPGRVVVVVSSDREVADGVRRPGVWTAAAVALVRLLR